MYYVYHLFMSPLNTPEIWCFFMDSMILNDILFVLRIMVEFLSKKIKMVELLIFPLVCLVITLMAVKDL